MDLRTVRVILVEDNSFHARTVRRMLARYDRVRFQLRVVRSAEECEKLLGGGSFDLLILDYSLPGEDGLSFLRRLSGRGDAPPVIMLTGQGDERLAAEAIRCGALDYFPKDAINSEVLAHAIHRAIEEHRWRTEEKRLHEELERFAITDPLTGLYNRRQLDQALETDCLRARRYARDLAFMMIDVDDFKRCNDEYGHPGGDIVLRKVAEIIRRTVRDTDLVARYGGEEFGVLLPETNYDEALLIGERSRAAVAAHNFEIDGQALSVTVSVGVCAPTELDDLNPESLVSRADDVLRSAKAAGKNRVHGSLRAQRPPPDVATTPQ